MKYKGRIFTILFSFVLIGIAQQGFSFGFTEGEQDVMNLQTFTVSDFGDETDQSNDVVWVGKYSRFAKQVESNTALADPDTNSCYLEYMKGKPLGLPKFVDAKQNWCLGVKAQFIKQSYNWIEIWPVKLSGAILGGASNQPMTTIEKRDTKPADNLGGKITNTVVDQRTNLNLEGIVKSLDVWVWGGNYYYWLEFHLMDYKGFLHRLSAGDIRHIGWLNMRTKVPEYIPQAEHHVPFLKNLKLVLMKLWSYPTERADQFYCYFDYMQVQTDVYVQRFNGDDLGQGGW